MQRTYLSKRKSNGLNVCQYPYLDIFNFPFPRYKKKKNRINKYMNTNGAMSVMKRTSLTIIQPYFTLVF